MACTARPSGRTVTSPNIGSRIGEAPRIAGTAAIAASLPAAATAFR